MPRNKNEEPKSPVAKKTGRRKKAESNWYFDKYYYTDLWREALQPETSQARKEAIREEIVVASLPIAKFWIRKNKLTQYGSEDDLMQEAALKVLKDFDKFKPDLHKTKPANAHTYPTTIIKNHLLTQAYKSVRTRRKTVSIDAMLDTSTSMTAQVSDGRNSSDPQLSKRVLLPHTAAPKVDIVAKDSLQRMIRMLENDEMGKHVLQYLGVSGLTTEGKLVPSDEKLKILSNGKLNIRSLVAHLKSSTGKSQRECLSYLSHLRDKYAFLVGKENNKKVTTKKGKPRKSRAKVKRCLKKKKR